MKYLAVAVFSLSLAGCASLPVPHLHHKLPVPPKHVAVQPTPAPVVVPAPAAPATFKQRWHIKWFH